MYMAHRLVVPPSPEMVMVPICTWIDIYKIIQVCMCVYLYVYICVLYTYMYICIYLSSIHVYIYMSINPPCGCGGGEVWGVGGGEWGNPPPYHMGAGCEHETRDHIYIINTHTYIYIYILSLIML